MAIVVGKSTYATHEFVVGDRVMLCVDVLGDTSYPTGGTVITPATFKLTDIHSIHPEIEPTGTYFMSWDSANSKLKCFSGFTTQVSNATDMSAKTFRLMIIGRGYPRSFSA